MSENPYQPPQLKTASDTLANLAFFDSGVSKFSPERFKLMIIAALLGMLCAVFFAVILLLPELELESWWGRRELLDVSCHLIVVLGFRQLLFERIEQRSGSLMLIVISLFSFILLALGVEDVLYPSTSELGEALKTLLILIYNCTYALLGLVLLTRMPNLYGMLRPLALAMLAEGLLDLFSWLPLTISALSYFIQDLCWALLFYYAWQERATWQRQKQP